MEDVTIRIPRSFLRDFLNMIAKPKGEREVTVTADIREQVVNHLLGEDLPAKIPPTGNFTVQPKKRHISPEGRARIAAAQRKRWAKSKRTK